MGDLGVTGLQWTPGQLEGLVAIATLESAAAVGAEAAFDINLALTRENFERNATGQGVVEYPTS